MAPVMAPDDRSNSPPIMSIATATAMMPRLLATMSIQPKLAPAVPKVTETAQKNDHTPMAPMMAPTSGRMKIRWKTER